MNKNMFKPNKQMKIKSSSPIQADVEFHLAYLMLLLLLFLSVFFVVEQFLKTAFFFVENQLSTLEQWVSGYSTSLRAYTTVSTPMQQQVQCALILLSSSVCRENRDITELVEHRAGLSSIRRLCSF